MPCAIAAIDAIDAAAADTSGCRHYFTMRRGFFAAFFFFFADYASFRQLITITSRLIFRRHFFRDFFSFLSRRRFSCRHLADYAIMPLLRLSLFIHDDIIAWWLILLMPFIYLLPPLLSFSHFRFRFHISSWLFSPLPFISPFWYFRQPLIISYCFACWAFSMLLYCWCFIFISCCHAAITMMLMMRWCHLLMSHFRHEPLFSLSYFEPLFSPPFAIAAMAWAFLLPSFTHDADII